MRRSSSPLALARAGSVVLFPAALVAGLAALALGASACGGGPVATVGAGGATGGGGAAPGGSGGAGGEGGGVLELVIECVTDLDCQLVRDCCSCVAIGPDDVPPACDVGSCAQDACELLGFHGDAATCQVGQCIVGFACDIGLATCNELPTSCVSPKIPTVDLEEGCYAPCVAPDQCQYVVDCTSCAQNEICVTQVGAQVRRHCVPGNPECADCACIGEKICAPTETCQDGPAGPSCIAG